MTVKEMFEEEKIPRDFITMKFDGEYYDKCQKFINDVWAKDVSSLQKRQQSWSKKILDDCVEKRIEG